MKKIVPPHGGELKPLLAGADALQEVTGKAKDMPVVKMSSRETSDLIMLAMGAFSPLDGFMRKADYTPVVESMALANGTCWPIPITLSVTEEQASGISEGSNVALVDEASGTLMGSMVVEDKYTYDRDAEAEKVFRTTDDEHPGVKKLHDQGAVYLGGPVTAVSEGRYPEAFPEFARPAETRAIFKEKGWGTVAAFQTRNPIHRSHEYLTKIAMEVCDGVLVHPIVGALKSGDIPAEVRMACYKSVIDKYYPDERVVLKVYPMEMRYGGPREAVLHAIIRQNFGCSHLIVGRDHAGVGSYYGMFDAQNIFDELPEGALHIEPLKLDWTFWCYKCEGMASLKTCPHDKEDRCMISGTELRRCLSEGEDIVPEFSRPEVLEILRKYYKDQG